MFNMLLNMPWVAANLIGRDVTKPGKIHIRRMRISCAKYVVQSKLVPATIAAVI